MIEALFHASIRGAVVVAVVWGVCRLVPNLPASTRAWLWWCASASFVVALCWTTPVTLAVLTPDRVSADVQHAELIDAAAVATTPSAPEVSASLSTAMSSPLTPADDRFPWRDGLAAIWFAGVVLSGAIGVRRWREAARLLRTSVPASPAVEATTEELAARLGIAHPLRVRLHSAVDVPCVVGLWRPTIVLPASPRDDSGDVVRMSICHELAHLRRRDLWLGCVPALAERLFFFHPFARLAVSEYALAREAACDAVVLDTLGVAPRRYGQWLLDLGVGRRASSLVGAGASGSGYHLRRRLLMLEQARLRSTRGRLVVAASLALLVAVVVPWRLVARQPPTLATVDIALASQPLSAAAAPGDTLASPMPDVTAAQPPVERAMPPAAQIATPPPPCVTTTPVSARAPDDPNVRSNASPVNGWWHMSADKALWVPSPPPGEATIGLGRYWVRPAGQGLTVRGRRLDGDAPPVLMEETPAEAQYGFFFGGPSIPTEGCWEFDVTSGTSRVTFVMEIHTWFEAFAQRPQTRVTFEDEVGRIESGGAGLVVTAIVVEDPATRTRRLGGARLELRDATRTVTLYEPFERLEGTRRTLERAAAGEFPTMVYAVGGTHNITPAEVLTIRGQEHTFRFASHTHVDIARLLVAAGDSLRARLP